MISVFYLLCVCVCMCLWLSIILQVSQSCHCFERLEDLQNLVEHTKGYPEVRSENLLRYHAIVLVYICTGDRQSARAQSPPPSPPILIKKIKKDGPHIELYSSRL